MHDPEILLAARELLAHGNYSSVVAVCTDVLTDDPGASALRLVLARALFALHEDDKAHHELRNCLAIDHSCIEAHRLLGELALDQNDLQGAENHFLAVLRIDPRDREAKKQLACIRSVNQPTATLEKLPAATVAVGCTSPPRDTHVTRQRFALGSESDLLTYSDEVPALGFGAYLVRVGVLSDSQLERALLHHHASGLRIGSAAVALGFASEPKVEWAALAYHGGAN